MVLLRHLAPVVVCAALAVLPAGARGAAVPTAPLPTLAAGARAQILEPLVIAGAGLRELAAAQRARERAHARTVELHRLRHSRTVRAALRRMWLAGAIDRAAYLGARATLWRAARTAARLQGPRRAALLTVLRLPGALAARRLLTSNRLPLVLLTVRRNAQYWALRPLPRPGERVTFSGDPVVFRYEAGQGLQVHQLSTAGRVNGIARDCLHRPSRCNRTALRRAVGRLLAVSSRRGGFRAWESLYRWGQGRPPWVSAMTQGTAIQALARSGRVLGDRRLTRAARAALGAFEQPPPVGVGVRAPGGRQYLMYSFAPRLRILNGFLQAITGLRDLAVLSGSSRARRLFDRGDRAARASLPRFDTGAWSRYLDGGHETDLGYHELTTAFLGNLCRRTDRRAYCRTAARFTRYEREPPRLAVAVGRRRPRTRRPVPLSVWVSKVSDVRVTVSGPRGTALLLAGRRPRGRRGLTWVPPAAGRYQLRVWARGLSGPVGVAAHRITVRPQKKARHHRRPHAATARR